MTSGQRLAYYQKSGSWVRVEKGWVSTKYFNTEALTSGAKGTVNASELNIRKEASSSSDKLGAYKKGDKVEILETSGSWGRTDKGWISLNYVTIDTTTTGTNTGTTITAGTKGVVNASTLNIRKEGKKSADKVGAYQKGDKVEILEVKDGWGRTDKGWISLKYVTPETTATGTTIKAGTKVVINTGELNIRKEGKKSADKVGTYKKGDKVEILEVKDGWGRTDKGWISLKYVTATT